MPRPCEFCPVENMFGKTRGRYDEAKARAIVKSLIDDALDKLWSLSDDDLRELVARHGRRNKTGSNVLLMSVRDKS